MPNTDIDIKVQWHSPDLVWAAVLVRDGEPWFLNGALVGLHANISGAVAELLGLMKHLIIHGENFLTEGEIPLEDRIWMFKLLDGGIGDEENSEMYLAILGANNDKDPYT
jgi:hypothetical protein